MPVFARFLPEMLKETPFVLVDKRRFFYGGNDGIRTHVTLRSTAFRVRLVTTTSIRFHVYHIVCLQLYYFITPRRAARYVRLLRCQGHPPRSLGRQTVH